MIEKISSKDGTLIACERGGSGSPLVLVHGTTSSAARWAPVRNRLEQDFEVWAMDRRGRGQSGDGPQYSIVREFEDVAAVVESIGRPVDLLGHSFGAICSLEAALLTPNIYKLILYEPPLALGSPILPAGVMEQMKVLLAAGDREAMLHIFLREVVHMTPGEIEKARSSPAWPARLAAAHTLPRELKTAEEYTWSGERFRQLTGPVLLCLGGNSPYLFKAAIASLADALTNRRIVTFAGQGHSAMDTAPELFLREVIAFLKEPPQP